MFWFPVSSAAFSPAGGFGHRFLQFSGQFGEVRVILHDLLQVHHSFRPRCPNHGFTVNSVNPESSFASKLVLQLAEPVFGISAAEVHRIHPTPCRAAKCSMLKVVVENHDVAGRCL